MMNHIQTSVNQEVRPLGADGRVIVTAPRQAGDAAPIRLDQPLLVIAFGGSGRMIATQIKANFIERFGDVPANAQILAFDSADEPISVRETRYNRVVELRKEHEFFRLERVPLAGIRRAPERHPEIVERIGNNLARIHRTIVQDGAAQERVQGLLSLMWNARRVEGLIGQALRRLTQRSEDLRHELESSSGINVVLVGSACGGQNSGAMLDAAYLVREQLLQLGDLADTSRVIGMVVLPGAFHGVRGPNLKPNTYAFFLELDYLMQGKGFEARYPGGTYIRTMERPFDYVFVLDGIDDQDRTWPNWQEVCALGAQALAVLFSTDVGMREIATAINEQGVLHGTSADGFGTYLATVGQAVIRFPAGRVLQQCITWQALAMVGELLRAPRAEDDLGLSVAGMLARLRDRLHQNENGAPYTSQIMAPASLESAPAEEVPAQARVLVSNFLQRRIFDDAFGQMQAVGERLHEQIQRELEEHLISLLDRGQPRWAEAWLQRAEEELSRQLNEGRSEQERISEELGQAQDNMAEAASSLEKAANAFFAWRKGQVKQALGRYLAEASHAVALYLDDRAEAQAVEILSQILQWVRGRRREVTSLINKLEQAQELLRQAQDAMSGPGDSRHEINLADDALIDELYRQHANDPAADLRQAIQATNGLAVWLNWTGEEITDHLKATASKAFEPLLKITVEDVLSRRWTDRSAREWIGRLEGLAAAAWNLDQALLPGGGTELASFLTLGVPDASTSRFADSGVTLASTHDPERIIALRTVYGASLDTLRPTPQWRQAYEQAMGRIPLHTLPQFQQEDDRGFQAFALALTFGFIRSQGTWFYYEPADSLEKPIRLGQGLERAIEAFSENARLQQEALQRVDDEIARRGVDQALRVMRTYVDAGDPRDDETTRQLRRAVRDYAEELDRAHRASRRAE